MTKQEALDVKEVLLQIRDSIPATYVDRIFHYYKTYIDSSVVKPCTCQPKYWNQFLIALRDKVEATLAQQETQVIINEEDNNSKED
jgi:hypothetical protein